MRTKLWLAGVAAVLLAACAALPHSMQIEHEGVKVAVAHRNGGSATVIFQSGLGDGMAVWSAVLAALPADMATFAYDRPGYGGSIARAGSRDPCTVARELHEILSRAGARPPFVLVGHSLGGIYQYAFARLYPDEVRGILLVGATHPEHWATVQRRTPNTASAIKGLRAIAFSDTERREFDGQESCLAELRTREFSPIPARLLMRGKADAIESAEFQAVTRELAARWPEWLPGMTLFRVEGASHYIQKDRPELVAREIAEIVGKARAGQ